MKINVMLKDPDGFSDAIDDAVRESLATIEDEDEREALKEVRREKVQTFLNRWVEYSEYVSIEFDMDAGTASVVPR
jgi:hypothetical protein